MGMMFIWPLLFVVLIVLCVVGVAWLAQAAGRGGPQPGSTRSSGEASMDILKRRYAGGEITRDQFEEMRRALES